MFKLSYIRQGNKSEMCFEDYRPAVNTFLHMFFDDDFEECHLMDDFDGTLDEPDMNTTAFFDSKSCTFYEEVHDLVPSDPFIVTIDDIGHKFSSFEFALTFLINLSKESWFTVGQLVQGSRVLVDIRRVLEKVIIDWGSQI